MSLVIEQQLVELRPVLDDTEKNIRSLETSIEQGQTQLEMLKNQRLGLRSQIAICEKMLDDIQKAAEMAKQVEDAPETEEK